MGEGSRPVMRRARADRIIEKIIAEAGAINADDRMLWRVSRVSVFGSYLTDKPMLGDLDIGLRLVMQPGGVDADKGALFRAQFPPPEHIRRDWFGRLCWPETYVRRRLRVGRNISLHDQDEVETEGYEHRVMFDDTTIFFQCQAHPDDRPADVRQT
jgi:hypothetical protein